jgi:hypothetical protein
LPSRHSVLVQIGVAGERHVFTTLAKAIRYMNDLRVGKPCEWLTQGFETENYYGEDFVSCYWSNSRGDFVQAIQLDERFNLEDFQL